MTDRMILDLTGRPPVDSEVSAGIVTADGGWQWSERAKAWIGPAYEVAWSIGDNVGFPVGPFTGGGKGPTVQCSPLIGGTPIDELTTLGGAPWFYFTGRSTIGVAATSGGSGVVFLVQTSGDVNAPPDNFVNVLDYLGNVVLTNGTAVVPYALDRGDGTADGDQYLDWPHRKFYQRQAGSWVYLGTISDPQQQISVSSLSAATPVFEGNGGPNSGADPVGDADLFTLAARVGIGSTPKGYRIRPNGTLIFMGALPSSTIVAEGQAAMWFDSTPGASAVVFTAKDSAGTVVTGNLPLT